MARARILKPGFFTNELLAELPFEGRLLFAGLWTLADRDGRLEDRPKRIKAALFPWDEVDVDALLAALELKGFIDRYAVAGCPLIQIAKFAEHQTPHARETASTLPRPENRPENRESSLRLSKPLPRSPVAVSDPVTGSGNGSNSAATSATPALLAFPTHGKPKVWGLTSEQLADWTGLYPNLDVLAECREALAWVLANPGRAKTASGMPRFLVNWFNRSVDRRGASTQATPTATRDYVWPCPHTPSHGSQTLCRTAQVIEQAKRERLC